jgi:hypothetical protein
MNLFRKIWIFNHSHGKYPDRGRDKLDNYLQRFKEPKDDFQRAFYKYRCQKFDSSKAKSFLYNNFFLYNIASFFVLIPLSLFWYCHSKQKNGNDKNAVRNCAIFASPEIDTSIIPKELTVEFNQIYSISFYDQKITSLMLDTSDMLFIMALVIRYPFNFYFLLKSIMKIAIYRSYIRKYNPMAIIGFFDFDFSSSILTLFCQNNNIEHINIMHGDYFFRLMYAFSRFDRWYVWDEHYIRLFLTLRAGNNKFIISRPPSLFIDVNSLREESRLCDYKYYLGDFDEVELIQIVKNMRKLMDDGYKVKIRAHPRYFGHSSSLLTNYLENDYIEESLEIGTEESLANTKNAIGVNSTVLYQAYLNGINVILDDLVFKEKLSTLATRDYIIFGKPYFLLSDMLRL